jgi:hypothetical protein
VTKYCPGKDNVEEDFKKDEKILFCDVCNGRSTGSNSGKDDNDDVH